MNSNTKATKLIAKPTNSVANGTNSTAKATNSVANGTKSIAKTCNVLMDIMLPMLSTQIGSPTILADPAVENIICKTPYPHGVYVPVGAMWGAHDIRKMADMGTLKVRTITV